MADFARSGLFGQLGLFVQNGLFRKIGLFGPDNYYRPSLSYDWLTTPSLTSPQGITQTYSGPSGKTQIDQFGDVVFAPENLAGFSEDFSISATGGWSKRTNYSVSAYSVDLPDGVAQAWTLVNAGNANSGEGTFNQTPAGVANGLYTVSVWLKAGTLSTGRLILKNASSDTIITVSNFALTSQWQRFSISGLTNGTTGGCRFEISTNGATGNILVAGGQIERCGYIRSYNRTTGSPYYGPRFDYYPNGVVYTGQNLSLYSEQFENAAWTKLGAAISSDNQVAPNGTTTADTLTENAAAATQHRLRQTVTSDLGPHTLSVYVKRGAGARHVQLGISAGSQTTRVYFDLTNIAVAVQSNATGTISDAGNGWYRVSLTSNVTGSTSLQCFLAMTDTTLLDSETYNGNGTSQIIWWGAQLNKGTSLPNYTPTTASAIQGTAIATPRGWRNEQAGTNLIADSQNYTTASWTRPDTTPTPNSIISPSGALDATLMTEGTAGNAAVISATAVITAGATVTGSVFVRRGNHDWIAILVANTGLTNAFVGYFNTATGVFGTTATAAGTAVFERSEVISYKNGFWRIGISGTLAAGDTSAVVFTRSASADNSITRVNNSTRYLWGSQVEQTTTPNSSTARMTSYVPTGSVSATRAAEQLNSVIGPEFNQSEGTIVVEWEQMLANTNASARGLVVSLDNGSGDRTGIFSNGGGGNVSMSTVVSSVIQANFNVAGAANTIYKSAYRYKANDFVGVQNGVVVGTDTSGSVPVLTNRRLGHRLADYQNGWIRRYAEYPVGLDTTTMQGLAA